MWDIVRGEVPFSRYYMAENHPLLIEGQRKRVQLCTEARLKHVLHAKLMSTGKKKILGGKRKIGFKGSKRDLRDSGGGFNKGRESR